MKRIFYFLKKFLFIKSPYQYETVFEVPQEMLGYISKQDIVLLLFGILFLIFGTFVRYALAYSSSSFCVIFFLCRVNHSSSMFSILFLFVSKFV